MDADGLPLVGPGIDYTKVEAINQKRTIAFINHFITHTSRFLNRFSCVCEEKLEKLHGRIQQLEVSLSLLEAKLSSIPGLESVTAPSSSTTTAAPQGGEASSAAPPPPPTAATPAPAYSASPAAAEPEAAVEEPQEEVKPANPVSKDPRYMKYFKMVQYGVPEQVVKGKMGLEGLDPSLLDTPDAPAPPDNSPQGGDDDSDNDSSGSDASFSD